MNESSQNPYESNRDVHLAQICDLRVSAMAIPGLKAQGSTPGFIEEMKQDPIVLESATSVYRTKSNRELREEHWVKNPNFQPS